MLNVFGFCNEKYDDDNKSDDKDNEDNDDSAGNCNNNNDGPNTWVSPISLTTSFSCATLSEKFPCNFGWVFGCEFSYNWEGVWSHLENVRVTVITGSVGAAAAERLCWNPKLLMCKCLYEKRMWGGKTPALRWMWWSWMDVFGLGLDWVGVSVFCVVCGFSVEDFDGRTSSAVVPARMMASDQ